MPRQNVFPHKKRYHIVLIPGFGGFDALGQVEYYAGITPLFQNWKVKAKRPDVSLHYFDNFPTAAVATRATRLARYLAKLIARGEIAPGDEVSLVGHSTGGLDIRWLIRGLSGNDRFTESDSHAAHRSKNNSSTFRRHRAAEPVEVRELIRIDVGSDVRNQELLSYVQRVVFLSVPHWGTNIADWVRSYTLSREAVVAELRALVAGSQAFVLDRIEATTAGAAADLTDADLLLAVQDALTEANDRNGDRTALRILAAHEAASELALYVRQIAWDFHVIDDLAVTRPPGPVVSPAHFNEADRERELELWAREKIEPLSFATLGRRPFALSPGKREEPWGISQFWTYPDVLRGTSLSAGTDISYRLTYRACAGGPFCKPLGSGKVTWWLGPSPPPLESWDNDGIVNTLSMLWPRGEIVGVPCDHLDIVGHYQLVDAPAGTGRKNQAYDALRSTTPSFPDGMFSQVWTEVFDFCSKND